MPFISGGGSSAALPTLVAGRVVLTTGNLTTTSVTFVDATGVTVTVTTGARRCLVTFSAAVFNSNVGDDVYIDLAVDGTRVGGSLGIVICDAALVSASLNASFSYVTPVLTAAAHTFKVQWAVSSALHTGTMRADATCPAILSVAELLQTT